MRALVTRLLSTVVASLALVGVLGVVGVASASASECPNEQVRSESNENPTTHEPYDMGLPECRAYEMVTPTLKGGKPIQIPVGFTSPGVSGGVVTYESYAGSFAEPEVFELFGQYTASRTPLGWVTSPSGASASMLPAGGSTLYGPDISQVASCGEPGERYGPFSPGELVCALREGNGLWHFATPVFSQTGTSTANASILMIGASRDLSHVVFNLTNAKSTPHLLSEDTATGTVHKSGVNPSGLYEISGIGTPDVALRLVSVNNNGESIGTTPPRLGNVVGRYELPGRSLHAVSEDGSTVFFEATPTGGTQTVYARIDSASTVSISRPSVADCAECQTSFATQLPAEYQGASADGSKVFFTTEQELFTGKTGNNLYEYDFDAPVGQRVTIISRGTSNAAVQGVLTNSDDGSHIYFVAQGMLTSTPNGLAQHAVAGADNLYAFERDPAYPAGHVSFVAMLCSGEHLSGTVADSQCPSSSTDAPLWVVEPEGRQSGRDGTTSDGRYFIFDTYANLIAEDSNKALAVYRYDAQTGELTWVSHGVSGFPVPNKGNAALIAATTLEGDYMGALPDVSNRGRAISENGNDIVFTTTEALSPMDLNGAPDTYLWHDGTVSLISGGLGAAPLSNTLLSEDSAVLSGSGEDIYFITSSKLVGQDVDELGDLYDARVGGGFPAPKVLECAAEGSAQERGEACQGRASGAPLFGSPVSASFTGGANLPSPTVTVVSSAPKSKSHSKSKSLTRAQKLAVALRTCKKVKVRKKRVACERKARRKYGGKTKSRTSRVASKKGRGR